MVYEIFEGNFERLEKKLNRIGNKCKKYGCDFCFSVIGETFREVIDESTKEKHIARFISENISSITGTVKNHSVYNGVKQTELTRCRVAA